MPHALSRFLIALWSLWFVLGALPLPQPTAGLGLALAVVYVLLVLSITFTVLSLLSLD
jgi:hypothetical protein